MMRRSPGRRRDGPMGKSTASRFTCLPKHLEKVFLGLVLVTGASNLYWNSIVTSTTTVSGNGGRGMLFQAPGGVVLPRPLKNQNGITPPISSVGGMPSGGVALPTRRISQRHFRPYYGFLDIEFRGLQPRIIRDFEPHETYNITTVNCHGKGCLNRPLSCKFDQW